MCHPERSEGSWLDANMGAVEEGCNFALSASRSTLLSAPTFRLTYELISTNNLLCDHRTAL